MPWNCCCVQNLQTFSASHYVAIDSVVSTIGQGSDWSNERNYWTMRSQRLRVDFGSILKLVFIEFLRFFHMWVEFVVGSLPRSERFFSGYYGFPLSKVKNEHFQIPIRSGTHGYVSASSYELLSAPWVKKITITITINLISYLYPEE